MIPTLLLPLLIPSRTSMDQGIDVLGRIRAFMSVARSGVEPGLIYPPYSTEDERPMHKDYMTTPFATKAGFRYYEYNHAHISLNIFSARISDYRDFDYASDDPRRAIERNPDGSIPARRVSDNQAIALAKRFFDAAGWGEGIPRTDTGRDNASTVVDGMGQWDGSLELHLTPAVGGARYEEGRYDSVVYVNRYTGQLDGFSAPSDWLPTSPATLIPTLSAASAQLNALRFGVVQRGESLSATRPFGLRIWFPRTRADETPEHAARRYDYGQTAYLALLRRRGILAYKGWLLGGSYKSAIGVVVDARTGEILDSEDPAPEHGTGGVGGGSPTPHKGAVDLVSVPRSWRVSVGKAAWSNPVKAALSPANVQAKGGKKLVITDGKAAFPATYDAKANLLAISGKTYRPGPALAKLLRRK